MLLGGREGQRPQRYAASECAILRGPRREGRTLLVRVADLHAAPATLDWQKGRSRGPARPASRRRPCSPAATPPGAAAGNPSLPLLARRATACGRRGAPGRRPGAAQDQTLKCPCDGGGREMKADALPREGAEDGQCLRAVGPPCQETHSLDRPGCRHPATRAQEDRRSGRPRSAAGRGRPSAAPAAAPAAPSAQRGSGASAQQPRIWTP